LLVVPRWKRRALFCPIFSLAIQSDAVLSVLFLEVPDGIRVSDRSVL